MSIDPEISGAAIVLVGNFNPAIFHPHWLISNGIEQESSRDEINLDVCHRDISRFQISHTAYFIEPDRFQLQTSVAPWIDVLDKTTAIFGELLTHTPIKAFGINKDIHFHVPTADIRNMIGRKLAPIEPWGSYGEEMQGQSGALLGGLLSLTMRSQRKVEQHNLSKNIRIEPSAQLTGATGIYMQANFHFDLGGIEAGDGASKAVALLNNHFDAAMHEADEVFKQIMELAK